MIYFQDSKIFHKKQQQQYPIDSRFAWLDQHLLSSYLLKRRFAKQCGAMPVMSLSNAIWGRYNSMISYIYMILYDYIWISSYIYHNISISPSD